MDERVPWDQYFMNIAQVVASRSTCPRKFVGAVIVRDRTILSTGYNGSIRGMPHCTEAGHMMENDHCVATIHAEANAIIQAAKNGVMIDGGAIYVTASPCWQCFKQIANAGIRRIVYGEFYRDDRIFSVAERLGMELLHIQSHVSARCRATCTVGGCATAVRRRWGNVRRARPRSRARNAKDPLLFFVDQKHEGTPR
jgi:dCMP deaminase